MSKRKKIIIDVDVVISKKNLQDRDRPIDRGYLSLEIDTHKQNLVQWKAGKGNRIAEKALEAERNGFSLDIFTDVDTFKKPKIIMQLEKLKEIGDCELRDFVFIEE